MYCSVAGVVLARGRKKDIEVRMYNQKFWFVSVYVIRNRVPLKDYLVKLGCTVGEEKISTTQLLLSL